MSEILRLEYDATIPSIRIEVDALDAHGNPILGAPRPVVTMPIYDLEPTLLGRLLGLLADLEPLARTQFERLVESPAHLREVAVAVMSDRHHLEIEKKRHELLIQALEERTAALQNLELDLAKRELQAIERDATLRITEEDLNEQRTQLEEAARTLQEQRESLHKVVSEAADRPTREVLPDPVDEEESEDKSAEVPPSEESQEEIQRVESQEDEPKETP